MSTSFHEPQYNSHSTHIPHIASDKKINSSSILLPKPIQHSLQAKLTQNQTSNDKKKQQQKKTNNILTDIKRGSISLSTKQMRSLCLLKKAAMRKSPSLQLTQHEQKLVKQAVSYKNLTSIQKSQLIQGYFLSKKILQLKQSMKNRAQLRKIKKFYGTLYTNISKSKHTCNFSSKNIQSTTQSYTDQKKQKIYQSANNCTFGLGKNKIIIKITNLMLVKTQVIKNQGISYSLRINIDQNNYELHASNYDNLLNKTITINFKKSLFITQPEITMQLRYLRQHFDQQIGIFKPSIQDFISSKTKVYQIKKAHFPIGTIQIKGEVQYFQGKECKLDKFNDISWMENNHISF